MNIIQELFDGYCADFKAKELGMSNSDFALEAFKNNPLVAIDPDGNLSRIEDNTILNSIKFVRNTVNNLINWKVCKDNGYTFRTMLDYEINNFKSRK